MIQLRRSVNKQVQALKDDGGFEELTGANRSDTDVDIEKTPSKVGRSFDDSLPGVSIQLDHNGEQYFRVGWDSADDHFDPRTWPNYRKIFATMTVCAIGLVTTMASAIDAAIITEASQEFHVAEVVESLATGIYLMGFGVGALIASPMSEMVGRYPVYLGTLVIFAAWLLGAALSPNIGSQLAFRFLAGLMGSAPLTVAGGSISDIWNTLQKTFGFPLFAIPGFGGPIIGMEFFFFFFFLGCVLTVIAICRTGDWRIHWL